MEEMNSCGKIRVITPMALPCTGKSTVLNYIENDAEIQNKYTIYRMDHDEIMGQTVSELIKANPQSPVFPLFGQAVGISRSQNIPNYLKQSLKSYFQLPPLDRKLPLLLIDWCLDPKKFMLIRESIIGELPDGMDIEMIGVVPQCGSKIEWKEEKDGGIATSYVDFSPCQFLKGMQKILKREGHLLQDLFGESKNSMVLFQALCQALANIPLTTEGLEAYHVNTVVTLNYHNEELVDPQITKEIKLLISEYMEKVTFPSADCQIISHPIIDKILAAVKELEIEIPGIFEDKISITETAGPLKNKLLDI